MRVQIVVFIFISSAILLVGCAKSNYIGKTYPPTTNVELFMDENAITREYELMGHIVLDGDVYVSSDKLQSKMIEEAKERGADAILIEGLDEVYTGSVTSTSGSTKPDGKGGNHYYGSTRTTESKHMVLKAKFLKYKN